MEKLDKIIKNVFLFDNGRVDFNPRFLSIKKRDISSKRYRRVSHRNACALQT